MKKRQYEVILGNPKNHSYWNNVSVPFHYIGETRPIWINGSLFTIGSKKEAVLAANQANNGNTLWSFEVKEVK